VLDSEVGEPRESDEMVPLWFQIAAVPYDRMWPDLQEWLPHVLEQHKSLRFRGYFEIEGEGLTSGRILAPILLPGFLSEALRGEVREAVATGGATFEFSFRGSKDEFDVALLWTWALLGHRRCQSGAAAPPRRASSTADSTNRLRDKNRVEERWQLLERGDSTASFFDRAGSCVALGFNAIVYGDHGPYIEFTQAQICWPTFTDHTLKGPGRTHFEHRNADASVKLYDQFKSVGDQPNPPPGQFAVQCNRADGYADYRPGCVYMACDSFFASGGT